MSDRHETYGDDTAEAPEGSLDEYGPGDATTRGLITGFHQIPGPEADDADPDELATEPEPIRMGLDWQPPADTTLRDVATQLVAQGLMFSDIRLVPLDPAKAEHHENTRIPLQRKPDAIEPGDQPDPVDKPGAEIDKTGDSSGKIELDQETRGRLRPEVLAEADTLLETFADVQATAEPRGDDYFTDATGNVQDIVTHNTGKNGELVDAARIGTMRRATVDLTNYAVKTGDEATARTAFGKLRDSDKWLVYAGAYETARVDPKLLADWRHELDTTYEVGEQDQSRETQASRLYALTKGKLHDYTSTMNPERLAELRAKQGLPAEGSGLGPSLEDLAAAREEYKQQAIEYGGELGWLLKKMQSSDDPYGEAYIRTWSPETYEKEATVAFARAGVWEGAKVLNGRHADSHTKGIVQAIKAIHGQLGKVDKVQLRTGSNGKLLRWINDGKLDGGELPRADDVQGHVLMLLEQVVPERLRQLELGHTSPDRSLRMAIGAKDFESVRAHYAATIDGNSASQNLRAALMVSEFLHDVQATEAAHDIFEGALLDEIAPVEVQVEKNYEPGFEGVVSKDLSGELDRLYAESSKLKDPVTSLHAKARIATMFLKIEPNSQRVGDLMTDIQKQWDVLERREGGDQELGRLYQSLRSAGFQMEPQWKRDGAGGFIGFRPVSPLLVRRNPSEYHPFRCDKHVYLETADELERTAATLNEVLGTDRYHVEIDDEDREALAAHRAFKAQDPPPVEGGRYQLTKHTIELTGPWRVLFSTDDFGCKDEFEQAAGNIRSGWPMNSNKALTDHLRQLVDQAEAEWQQEQDVAA